MKEITYINATTVEQAVSALGQGNAVVIAGGTDLITYMMGFVSPNMPDTLVNIKSIPELYGRKEEGGMFKIGPLETLTNIAYCQVCLGDYAALAEAARKVGTPELRNMGTIGGNICQAVRCWYYRSEHNAFNCLRKGGGLCNAVAGDNRYQSIFGAVDGCVAVNPSDTAPALVALGAKIVTTKQTVEAEDFFAVNGEKITVLDDDEIITEIQIPTPEAGTKSAFIKFAIRKAFDFAIVSCAAAISSSSARICLNGVYNMPYRSTDAENAIAGKAINETNADDAAEAAVADASPLSHNGYKVQIAKAMVKRAILACA
jgi:xanthine dehydrogenase YagS FAD-binding subunit